MQGKLHEIDTANICRLLSKRQYTGELWIESTDPDSYGITWLVHFVGGSIACGGNPDGKLDRLQDFLRGLNLEDALTSPVTGTDRLNLGLALREYETVWLLLQGQVLTAFQASKILQLIIQEVFFDLCRLRSGNFYCCEGQPLQPQLLSLDTLDLLAQVQTQVQHWYSIFPHVSSLEHSPKSVNPVDVESSAFNLLGALEPYLELESNPSLRQIARYRHQPPIHIVKEVYEAITAGVVTLLPTRNTKPAQPDPSRILCIDPSASVCSTLAYLLTPAGYTVTTCNTARSALTTVFEVCPHLILCSTALPDLDGYQLCAMLRQSRQFRTVPIVLMLSEGGYSEQRRTLIYGASNYLVKPFLPQHLLSIVARHLPKPTK